MSYLYTQGNQNAVIIAYFTVAKMSVYDKSMM